MCAGVWAGGALVLTVLLKVAVPVEFHDLRLHPEPAPAPAATPLPTPATT